MWFCVIRKIRELLLFIGVCGVLNAHAGSFSQFLRQIDQEGKVALLVAADCKPCQRQREILKGCEEELRQKLIYVSLSTAHEWKKLRLHPPAGGSWSYLSREQLHRWNVRGTPTFIFKDKTSMGLKTCEELSYFLKD